MIKFSTAVFFLFLLLCFAAAASAATFNVSSTADTADANPGNGACADASANCSLRAAISEANALAGPDIITLGAVVYQHSLAPNEENQNAGGDWDIRSDITINGAGAASTFVQGHGCAGGGADRVFDVISGVTLTLNDLTIRGGCAATVGPGPGGGINNAGTLVTNNVTVSDNIVQNLEGNGSGGGIYNTGTMTLNNTTVTNNFVQGGIIGVGVGGGIRSQSLGAVVINNSSISGNRAEGFQGFGYGGGMYIANLVNLTITNSHFDNNTVGGPTNGSTGGGLYILCDASSVAAANITNTTFNNNTTSGAGTGTSGIGLYVLTGVDPLVRLNVILDQVTINGNSGSGPGAGIGVYSSKGALTLGVKNSTISNNVSGSTGGGVDLNNLPQTDLTVGFSNSTISGNSATEGGGVALRANSGNFFVHFDYTTLTNNTASVRGGGLSEAGFPDARMQRTAVAGNTAPAGPDISTHDSISSQDYNHIGNLSGATIIGNTVHNTTGPAMLGALANNGGPTLTHMPDAASPLVDGIPFGQGGCNNSVIGDQRGLGRTVGTGCDKGSVERGATLPAGPWNISGTVRTAGGLPIRNVLVRITGGAIPPEGGLVYTGQLGTYAFFNLPGGTYTVTVKSRRFTITGNSQTIPLGSDNLNVNFTGDPEAVPSNKVSTGNSPPARGGVAAASADGVVGVVTDSRAKRAISQLGDGVRTGNGSDRVNERSEHPMAQMLQEIRTRSLPFPVLTSFH